MLRCSILPQGVVHHKEGGLSWIGSRLGFFILNVFDRVAKRGHEGCWISQIAFPQLNSVTRTPSLSTTINR